MSGQGTLLHSQHWNFLGSSWKFKAQQANPAAQMHNFCSPSIIQILNKGYYNLGYMPWLKDLQNLVKINHNNSRDKEQK